MGGKETTCLIAVLCCAALHKAWVWEQYSLFHRSDCSASLRRGSLRNHGRWRWNQRMQLFRKRLATGEDAGDAKRVLTHRVGFLSSKGWMWDVRADGWETRYVALGR
jgi:hypothetical protein